MKRMVEVQGVVFSEGLLEQVQELLKEQQKIQAIKLFRQETNCGLKQSKDIVEEIGYPPVVLNAAHVRALADLALYGSPISTRRTMPCSGDHLVRMLEEMLDRVRAQKDLSAQRITQQSIKLGAYERAQRAVMRAMEDLEDETAARGEL